MVSGFQDDLDPEDFNMVKNTYNDIKTPSNQNVKISSNAIRSNDNNYSFNKSKSPSLINEMSEDLGSMTIKPTTINHLELQNEEEKVSYLSENSLGENIADNVQVFNLLRKNKLKVCFITLNFFFYNNSELRYYRRGFRYLVQM